MEKAKIEEKPLEVKPEETTENHPQELKKKSPKKFLILLFVAIFIFSSALGAYLALFVFPPENSPSLIITPEEPSPEEILEKTYSPLTGLELSDSSLVSNPTFCVQIPNGLDGARPQVGLADAGVVFEAIAEAGITRFAAIFQNPSTSVIGPIRSLRLYYLNWDTPFDCTVVHAGGADNALSALSAGGYRDLTENYTYMWRGSSANNVLVRQWNNLFTSGDYLKTFNSDRGYSSSNVKGFIRDTKENSDKSRIDNLATNPLDIDEETTESVSTIVPKTTQISFQFGSYNGFNPSYTYNQTTNTYDRFYADGEPHLVYTCPEGIGETSPELSCGNPTQLSPTVVIAMIVDETLDSDGVHQKITTIGSGKAYIFQNGTSIEGTWEKSSVADQIIFKNADGETLKLAPGQTFISAIPAYGSVSYE